MSTPKIEQYSPKPSETIEQKLKGLTNAYVEVMEHLRFLLGSLDSDNVKRLNTNRTSIRSNAGETVINGPLLVMKDKQSVPVIRLQMGYDPASLDFVFNLMNAAGDVTVNIDSSGNLTVERGTFKGSITIGTGDNVFKVDANGMYLGDTIFADAPFKVTPAGAATATNLTVTGGTIRTAAAGSDRIELTGSGLTSYNGSNQKEGVAIETGLYGFSKLALYVAGVEKGGLNAGAIDNLFLETAPGVDLVINPSNGSNNRITETWNCSMAAFTFLSNGVSNYATESYAAQKGADTGSDSHTHTVTIGGVTYTTSSDTHSHTQT
jgi:hypothetical protein